ncbi:MAG: type II toxin-antitoxin system RelE/ParE family toxin [Candidatus Paceibacterota bacterium]|jgi:addiction module RelE/StbE family toxin
MYELVIKTSARKEFARLDRVAQARILVSLDRLCRAPFQGKELHGDLKGLRSLRVWPYRIIYEIIKHELIVFVVEISHRKDAYR